MLKMNIIQLFETFETNLQAVEYLERVRWDGKPTCHYCESERTSIHKSKDRAIRRWQCHECHRAFSVTVGTVFHRTHVPLKKWFLLLALMLNAKKSASSCQIARDIGMNQPTVWSMMHRIRAAMALDPEQKELFKGIVEADETHIGGKPRKANRVEDKVPHPRGLPVRGRTQTGGRVQAQVSGTPTSDGLEWFIDRFVEKDGTILITDQNPIYRQVGRKMFHAVINHSLAYVEQLTCLRAPHRQAHTNGIEGFWALVKRAWIGQHHHYSVKYMPLYLAEACFKYNRRGRTSAFRDYMLNTFVSRKTGYSSYKRYIRPIWIFQDKAYPCCATIP